jgi:cytoskeletal protein CcmA (bactofilin family)
MEPSGPPREGYSAAGHPHPGSAGHPHPGGAGDAHDGDGRSSHGPGAARRPTEITALLGRGTHFEGKLSFEGRIRVDGSFKGEIRGDDVLVIGEGAFVEGKIEVSTCIVTAGEVRADIRARDAIELYPAAVVVGSLHAPAIFIDRGVKFEGTCTMAALDEPAASAAGEAPADLEAPTVAGR